MKKIVLGMTFLLAAMIGLYGIVKISEKENPVSQHNDMDITDAGLDAGDKSFEMIESNTPVLSYGGDSEKTGYLGDDLVYRDYSGGNYVFLAIDSDGNSVDIAPVVKVNVSADGGTLLLN